MGITRASIFGLGILAMTAVPALTPAAAQTTQPFELAPATQPVPLAPATEPFSTTGPAVPTTASTTAYYSRTATSGYRYSDAASETAYPAPAHFERGRFDFSIGGQGFVAHGNNGDESLGFVTFDFDYFFLDNLSVGLELGVSPGSDRHHHDDNEGVRAGEELVLVRWHCLTAGPLSLYVDGGIGGLEASPDFPSGTRRNDFLGAAGGGLTWEFAPHFYGALGARAAFLEGGDWDDHRFGHHHTWSDGFQYYGGLTFVFP